MVAEARETRRRVRNLQEESRIVLRRGCTRAGWEVVSEIGSLLSEQSLVWWPSFPEEMSGGDGVMMDLYSMFTLQSLHHLSPEMSRLFKTCLTRHLSLGEIYSRPSGLPVERYRY